MLEKVGVGFVFCRHRLNFRRVRVLVATLVPGLCLQNIDQTKQEKAEKLPKIIYFNEKHR